MNKKPEEASRATVQHIFASLYRCSDAMRMAPCNSIGNNYETIFRAMLVAWAAENNFEPDLSKLSHNDAELYRRLTK